MKRKVVQIAGFTKVVSLPSRWVKQQGIGKGDDLEVKEEGSNLIISSDSRSKPKKACIDLTKTDKFLRRFVNIQYRLGYDEVEFKLKNPHQANLIQQEVSQRLLGFEIVEQTDNFCKIRSITKGIEEEFDVILRRIFIILTSIAKEGIDALKNQDFDKLQELIQLDDVINRFANFCQRTLNVQGYADSKTSTVVYFVVTSLEMISDSFTEIYRTALKNKKIKYDPRIIELFEIVAQMIHTYHLLFYQFTIDRLVDFDDKWKSIISRDEYWFKNYKTFNERFIAHYLHSVAFKLHHLTDMTC